MEILDDSEAVELLNVGWRIYFKYLALTFFIIISPCFVAYLGFWRPSPLIGSPISWLCFVSLLLSNVFLFQKIIKSSSNLVLMSIGSWLMSFVVAGLIGPILLGDDVTFVLAGLLIWFCYSFVSLGIFIMSYFMQKRKQG